MIYLDNAATTVMDAEVLKEMTAFYERYYYNPSAAYYRAAEVKNIVEQSRRRIAGIINAKPENIIFTSGGTESDNLALKGAARAMAARKKGKHIIVSAIEHNAVLKSAMVLEREGFELSYLGADADGRVNLKELEKLIRKDTIIISVMYANNETGVIQPVQEIGRIALEHKILFMSDAVQAAGNIPLDVQMAQVNFLTASAHKFHGPKGTGFLYVSDTDLLIPCTDGGGQERGMRSGTENVPGIYGMSLAFEKQNSILHDKMSRETALRNYMADMLLNNIADAEINGTMEHRLPNNINISFKGINGASLVKMLDNMGVMVSAGSACSSNNSKVSHVLVAMGLGEERARSSIRITLSGYTTKEETDDAAHSVMKAVAFLRRQ